MVERQLTAFNNSGGGILVFGIENDGTPTGLSGSLTSHFDPAIILDKLRRHAPTAQIPTAYLETEFYNKRYGFLLIGSTGSVIVFDKVGNMARPKGKGQETVLQPGVVYIRRRGQTTAALQNELDKLVGESIQRGVTGFLARIEHVASLPAGTELIARQPSSDRGYVLVSAGQGVPVSITASTETDAVPLTEVLSPDLPLSSLDAEVVAQLRQWKTDRRHRVGRALLGRWYLGRRALTVIPDAAEFCLLSAVHDWGYPMFWAAQLDRSRLEDLLKGTLGGGYPERNFVPYLVGAYFFDRRAELVGTCDPPLPKSLRASVKKLLEAPDADSYRNSAWACVNTLSLGHNTYNAKDLVVTPEAALAAFDDLVRMDETSALLSPARQVARRLDMVLYADKGLAYPAARA